MTNYSINTPLVTSETIDDETIIIDFESGTYYNLHGTANQLWQLLQANYAAAEVVCWATASYSGDPLTIDTAIHDFIDELKEAKLIVERTASVSEAIPPNTAKVPFTAPRIERHTDIQDLLLLDPLHDVGMQGWPTRTP